MSNLKPLGAIGSIVAQLDISDPDNPALILTDNAQAEHLAHLLSPEPLIVDWVSESADHIVLRIPYTPAVDSLIVDLVDLLVTTRYAIPHLVQLSLLDTDEVHNEHTN